MSYYLFKLCEDISSIFKFMFFYIEIVKYFVCGERKVVYLVIFFVVFYFFLLLKGKVCD